MRDLRARLDALAARDQRRALRTTHGVDLTSNDYLGLSTDPRIRDALIEALARGAPHGSTGSRLLSGQHPAWSELEARFAAWQGAEAALYFATGFAANSGLIAALAEPDDVIVSDALNHASLIDGARLTRAERVIVPHADVDAVDAALAARPGRTAWVVIESLHSMEGDEPALRPYVEVCERHGARLLVDDAHATGLEGPQGQGRVVGDGLRERVFASVHTCGKALGQSGAFVVGSQSLIDWLVNAARPFIFSTAPAPFLAAGLHAALDVVTSEPALRARPRALADRLRSGLAGRVDTGRSTGPIVPLIVGTNAAALALQAELSTRGWDARAIRPPTVAEGTSRVRVVMRAPLTDAQVDSLVGDVCAAT
jgi:8-amino-7-oxononanoate synthase